VPQAELREIIALSLVLVVHLIGALALVWALLEDSTRAGYRRRWGFGGGGGEDPDPPPPAPRPTPGRAVRPPLPLADAAPASARLRGPGRLADARDRPARRPDHAPEPARTPR
jgi:hypothetical protein